MNVETVPIDSIHVDPANANEHSEEDVVGLMAKLATFEQVEPLVVQAKTRKVIGGNGRLEAMRRLGWTEVDVHLVDVDNVTAIAMGIALNTRKSRFIDERLAEQLKALQSEDFDLAAVGYSDDDLQGLIDGLANEVLGDGTTQEAVADPSRSLAERFGVPPFSVLDARQGYWQERKRAWILLGIQSELGRGGAAGQGMNTHSPSIHRNHDGSLNYGIPLTSNCGRPLNA